MIYFMLYCVVGLGLLIYIFTDPLHKWSYVTDEPWWSVLVISVIIFVWPWMVYQLVRRRG